MRVCNLMPGTRTLHPQIAGGLTQGPTYQQYLLVQPQVLPDHALVNYYVIPSHHPLLPVDLRMLVG